MGTPPENFEDQPGPINHLGLPCPLEVTLLNRRESTIHDHDPGLLSFHDAGDFLDLALADESRGTNIADRHDPGFDDGEIDRAGKADGFLEPGFRRAQASSRGRPRTTHRAAAQMRLDDERASGFRAFSTTQSVGTRIEAT